VISATEAKTLTDEQKENDVKEWYKQFSIKLEESIMKQIDCSCYGLIIHEHDNLNEFGWIINKSLRDKVKQELELLGYKFYHIDEQQATSVEINWE